MEKRNEIVLLQHQAHEKQHTKYAHLSSIYHFANIVPFHFYFQFTQSHSCYETHKIDGNLWFSKLNPSHKTILPSKLIKLIT